MRTAGIVISKTKNSFNGISISFFALVRTFFQRKSPSGFPIFAVIRIESYAEYFFVFTQRLITAIISFAILFFITGQSFFRTHKTICRVYKIKILIRNPSIIIFIMIF